MSSHANNYMILIYKSDAEKFCLVGNEELNHQNLRHTRYVSLCFHFSEQTIILRNK